MIGKHLVGKTNARHVLALDVYEIWIQLGFFIPVHRFYKAQNKGIAGPNIDKNSVQLLVLAPFYENYSKLYFGAQR